MDRGMLRGACHALGQIASTGVRIRTRHHAYCRPHRNLFFLRDTDEEDRDTFRERPSSKIVNWSVRPDPLIFRLLPELLQTQLHLLGGELLTVQGSASGE